VRALALLVSLGWPMQCETSKTLFQEMTRATQRGEVAACARVSSVPHTPLAASGPTMVQGRFRHALPAGDGCERVCCRLPYNVLPACSAWKVDSSKEGVAGEMRYWREAFDAVDTDADGYQHTHAHGMPGPFEYLPQGRISLDMHLRMGGPCPRLGAIPGHW
jgi:hypothetical protein